MSKTDLIQLKKMYEETPMPHKIIKLSEMSYIGDNLFNVQGKEIFADDSIERKLDRLVGISSDQRAWVQNASDKSGLKNFRNYMQVAYDMHANQEIVLVADNDSRKIVDVMPLKGEYLSISVFFSILQIFMDSSGYTLQDTFYNPDRLSEELTVYLQSPDEETVTIDDNEVFLPNGIFMRWSFSEIEVGNFFTRIVCLNGATESSTQIQARIHSFSDTVLRQFLGTVQNVITQGFQNYSQKVLTAMSTKMSLAELQSVHKSLLQVGLNDDSAEEIIPYKKTLEKGKLQGMSEKTLSLQQNLIATDFNVWQIYNRLTAFATHSQIWEANNLKRQRILGSASRLLNKKHDIKHFMMIV